MFNPLTIWDERVLEGLIQGGHRFFVRQDFARGHHPLEDRPQVCLLLCHYTDYFRAREHFDALGTDPFRFLYPWEEPEHRQRLLKAAAGIPGYRVYANLFRTDWERLLTDQLREQIRAYVRTLGWKPSRGVGVEPQFYPHFGEVHVCLKYRGREVRVSFAEIERTT